MRRAGRIDHRAVLTLRTPGYQAVDRCNLLAGCSNDSVGRNHPGVDTVGVSVDYSYRWHTPLQSLLGWTGNGVNFTRSNAMRMEPIL